MRPPGAAMVARMPSWRAIALVAALIATGCENGDDRGGERPPAPAQVRGELDLPRAQAGAPDAGTRAGHGADRHVLQARRADPVISGRVEPASAAVELADASGRRAPARRRRASACPRRTARHPRRRCSCGRAIGS